MGPACVQGCSSQAAGRPEEWRRGIDILSASWEESPSGYRESGQQEEGEEVGRLTGVSTAIVSGFLLGSPHRDIRKFTVHILLKPGLENFKHYFTSV